MKDFWKKSEVEEYVLKNLYDIDEKVRLYGGCPNNEDYKILRKYYYIEFIGGQEQFEKSNSTKEQFEIHKDDDNNEFVYSTDLNYDEFLDKFWYDSFEQVLFGFTEPNEQLDFISCVKDTFFELKFEGQAKMFLKNVITGLDQLNTELNYLLKNKNTLYSVEINKIQEVVINHYAGSYLNTKAKIINNYKFIYPEIKQQFEEINEINNKLTREEILKKLIGDNKNLMIFKKYEEKLINYNFLSNDYEWLKNSASFSRFFSHCLEQRIFKTQFIENTRGIDFLRQLYGFEDGRNIDSPSKRKKQLTNSTKHEFNFLNLA